MRITKTVTINVRIPKFEAVCREMWTCQGGEDFTTAEWRGVGIIKKDAIARSIADPVVRAKFDDAIAKLLKKKDVRDYDFYAENVAFDVIGLLPAKHWISQAAEAVMDKYYPDGM
jgi:hypothetical protein